MEVKTLSDLLLNSKERYKNLPAFQMKEGGSYRVITFEDVYYHAKRLSAELIKQGIGPGDRVGILSENRPEWGISYFAIALSHAIAVPLDAHLMQEELDFILKDSGAKFVIVSAELFNSCRINAKTFLMENIKDLIGQEKQEKNVSEDDLAAIIYTSGTTGCPKGVMLTHKNIISNIISVATLFDIGKNDNFLSVLPLHHTFECTCGFFAPFYLGAKITYAESLKSYNLIKNMQETKVTIMCGVPLLYNLFYDGILREAAESGPAKKFIFSALLLIAKNLKSQAVRKRLFSMIHKKLGGHIRFWVSGGAAIDPEVIKGFELFGITIYQGYGLTESAPILTCNNAKHNKIGSAGRPIPGVKLKITDQGEIIANGPNIMKRYYKRPDLTAEVLRDTWLYTGDKGYIDGEGYVFITGRLKDLIVTGSGENVAPEEIEFHIGKIKGIKESCVLGVIAEEGMKKGLEEILAIIVPDYDYFKRRMHRVKPEDIEVSINEEIKRLNGKLMAFKRIAKVRIRSIELPKTSTRKVKRFQVRREMGL